MVAVVLSYFLVFSPTIKRLNTELMNTRAAVLLFPGEVVNGIPAIRNLMRDMSKGGAAK